MSLRTAIIGFIVSAIAVLITGPFMAKAAGEIAATSGLGNTFVGTTLVACTTSFAELVTTATAVRMGAMDLAIGNIYGSNAFNMVLLLPLDLASPAPLVASVSSTHVVTCFAVILVTSIALLGQLYSIEKRIAVVEPDAVLVIVLVIACLGVIYALR
jgi:cation:H+ antiporter